jgi:hypothetical protein
MLSKEIVLALSSILSNFIRSQESLRVMLLSLTPNHSVRPGVKSDITAIKSGFLKESIKRPVTISDLADFLNIESPNGYKNFVEEFFFVLHRI